MIQHMKYSIVIPVYNNEDSLPNLFVELNRANNELPDLEIVFVIDGSPDNSATVLSQLAEKSQLQIQLIHLTRNFGAVVASRLGLRHSRGDFVTIMAADLQDPIELIIEMLKRVSNGPEQLVVAARRSRKDPLLQKALANFAWLMLKKSVMNELPHGGFDTYAISRSVAERLIAMEEPNFSPIAQLLWLGYPFSVVEYDRQERESGKSSWKLRARVRYFFDSIISLSLNPLTWMFWVAGVATILASALILSTILSRLNGNINSPGYSITMVTILLGIALQQVSTIVIGAYVWRTYQTVLSRPIGVERNIQYFNQNVDNPRSISGTGDAPISSLNANIESTTNSD